MRSLQKKERGEREGKKRRGEERRGEERGGEERARKGRRQEGPTTSHEDISISRLFRNHQKGIKRLAIGARKSREYIFKGKEYFKKKYQLVQMLLRDQVRLKNFKNPLDLVTWKSLASLPRAVLWN